MIFSIVTGLLGCADGSYQIVFRLVGSEMTSDQLSLIESRLAELASEFGFQEIQVTDEILLRAADETRLRVFTQHRNSPAPPEYSQTEGASGLGHSLTILPSRNEIFLTQGRGREEVMFVGVMRERIQAILKEIVGDDGYTMEMRLWRRSALA